MASSQRIYTTGILAEVDVAIVWSVIGILVCGGLGGFAAWALVTSVGWVGTAGAIAAAVTGMVIAVALWAGMTSLLRALRWIK
jgi:hypothetical protein